MFIPLFDDLLKSSFSELNSSKVLTGVDVK